MADIVNLRQVRKMRRRTEAAAAAAENRALHGRSLGERQQTAQQQTRLLQHLDQHQLMPAKPELP